MLDLHRKVDRIDQLLERQNDENEKKNAQHASILNDIKTHSNAKLTHLNVKSNNQLNDQTKQINRDAAKKN